MALQAINPMILLHAPTMLNVIQAEIVPLPDIIVWVFEIGEKNCSFSGESSLVRAHESLRRYDSSIESTIIKRSLETAEVWTDTS